MKYMKQFSIILTISLIAELMEYLIQLPIAASIYGLILMLVGLITGWIPLDKVEGAADYLVAISITGLSGTIGAEAICKLFRIKHPIAKGLAVGTASHALGTTKAMEWGEIEGAMSSLSIVVAGIMTVVSVSIFANFI